MAINTMVPQKDWSDYFVTFSNGNRGREASIEVFGTTAEYEGPSKLGKLMAVDYDPDGHGNDIVVTTGVSEIDYSHTIPAPVEVLQAQGDDGIVNAIEIIDQQGTKTVLRLN